MSEIPAEVIDAATEAACEELDWLTPGQVRAAMEIGLEAAAPLIAAAAAHDALCWQQPADGRLIACDRKKDHQGGHSWEKP